MNPPCPTGRRLLASWKTIPIGDPGRAAYGRQWRRHRQNCWQCKNGDIVIMPVEQVTPSGLPAYLKSLRKRHGLTQRRLSELSGISDTVIRAHEAGRGVPTLETLEKYAAAYGLRLDLVFSVGGDNQ